MWSGRVPACLSHRRAALGTPPPSGHASRGDVSRAGNWAGPRKSPSGRQIPTGLEASGVGASLSDSLAAGPLCLPSVLWEQKQRSTEGLGHSTQPHSKVMAEWRREGAAEPVRGSLCEHAWFPSSPSSWSAVPPLHAPSSRPSFPFLLV